MSVSVEYKGQRKAFRLASSMAPLQTITEAIASAFGVDATHVSLVKGKTVVDRSAPFSMTGLPNNALLELVLTTAVKVLPQQHSYSHTTHRYMYVEQSGARAVCKIALSVEGGASITSSIDETRTLLELLEGLVREGQLPPTATHPSASPAVIYMRQIYPLEAMAGTTLGSLGLGGCVASPMHYSC